MRQIALLPLSLFTCSALYGAEITLEPLNVEATYLNDVAQVAQTSADVAQALSNNVPSIDMSRRSGIANDIFIRGQKRDNITVEVDDAKIYGACPNRMDPPASHIVANQIQTIEVIEGPYDVTSFGVLSGGVKIKTKAPSQKEQAQLHMGFGSWNYNKFGVDAQGGTKKVRFNLTASMESSDQYKDGNSNSLAQQVDAYAGTNPLLQGVKYKTQYHDMQAYSKKSAMAKLFISTLQNQELRLSVTANRSDNIMYPNSKMDAIYDDSNLYNVEYNIDAINSIYQNINIKYYHSDVDHPMGTDYRNSSNTMPVMTNWLQTNMDGIKLNNLFVFDQYKVLFGLDASNRQWDGHYEKDYSAAAMGYRKSIDRSVTKNRALFVKTNTHYGALDVEVGARYDDTTITNDTYNGNDYQSFGANLIGTYHFNRANTLALAVGQAYRVPDARELYFVGKTGNLVGTPNLDQVRNQEVDLSYNFDGDDYNFKVKTFYSMLDNYIYIKKGVAVNAFSNIDATLYGAELSGSYYLNDDMTLDFSLAYKRGKKDTPLAGQTDTDLADIAPLRGKLALNYEYARNSLAMVEFQGSKRWDTIDSDNGEQVLAGWGIINAKIKHAINKQFDFTVGVNNLFNKTYAKSNTYADLTLVTAGGTSDVMLLNEPGRYLYTNLDFKF